MTLIQSIILGIVQGLTEFLPVSSSGHLVLFEKILNVEAHDIVFEVLVHVGTMLAVVVYFRKKLLKIFMAFIGSMIGQADSDSKKLDARLGWYIILGTIPAGIIGVLFKHKIEAAFASPKWTAVMLLVTAVILFSTRFAVKTAKPLNFMKSIIIGIAQAVAILPGISRSGSTISAGMHIGVDREEAAEFSFLLSIPAIIGAAILKILDFVKQRPDTSLVANYLIAALIAAVIGYISISVLLRIVKKGKFFYFGLYCLIAGAFGLLFL